MPKSRAVLDSSPVFLASPRRPPKRSASTASLPTPPRTHHKRSHSRGSAQHTDSDSDSGDEHHLGSDDGVLLLGNKKRRTSLQVKGQDTGEEEEFWMGSAKDKSGVRNRTGASIRSPSPSPSISPSPILLRTLTQAPVSPPPSRRQTGVHASRPVTPKPSTTTLRIVDDSSGPVRDSPNNPFLEDSPISLDSEPRTPSPPADFVEKPTITYVFRGMKAEFANPLYQLSPSTRARAALPIEHPDYSPTGACPPRLLFPALHRAKHLRTPSPSRGRRRRLPNDDGDLAISPNPLTFQKELELLQETDSGVDVGELGGIGDYEEKDDPIRLAMGPVRR